MCAKFQILNKQTCDHSLRAEGEQEPNGSRQEQNAAENER